ncbi:outer membrane biogenesis protein BamB [Rubripirellula lacrimiformis]|uniref:Outer membrane biogenesis protein BamB n=1 Tax=Rubripirellula lacrimiformis TaxID=1930273 RepID=A0A517NH21_9BACT|nr:PQQ-binding-like beta-propeller repeat protein [Rubripirellula lacrimiformis]QDT06430.1 outer membrane biogenesis protein BamB [Rubripirellula lacrimiformis]
MKPVLVIASLLFPLTALAENWPHWRGPTGNGVAVEGNPPTKWSVTENVKWRAAIPGNGTGSPVVWDDRVIVTTAVPTGRRTGRLPELDFQTLCFSRADGNLLWKQTAVIATPHQPTHSTHGFASASPCTDGTMVYSHFGSRGLYAYTMDGKLVWKHDEFDKMNTRNDFGEGSSPTIAGQKILVPWDHEGDSYLYAFNKTNGELIWKTPRDEPSCWATPMVIDAGGTKQVVMNGQTCARAYDLETGKELWRCAGQTQRPAASPLFDGTRVFVGSGYQGSFMAAFDPTGRGDLAGSEAVLWSINRDTPDIASPMLSGNRLFFFKGKSGLLSCADSNTGNLHYSAVRLPGIRVTYASPVAAGGFVYLTGRGGTTVVIEDSNELKVVNVNSLGEGVDATPAIVDDEMFIRGQQHLFCIAEGS